MAWIGVSNDTRRKILYFLTSKEKYNKDNNKLARIRNFRACYEE